MRITTTLLLLVLLAAPVGFAEQHMGEQHKGHMDSTMHDSMHQGMMTPPMDSPKDMMKHMDKHFHQMQMKLDEIEAQLTDMQNMTEKQAMMNAIKQQRELTKELHVMMANHRNMSHQMMSMMGMSPPSGEKHEKQMKKDKSK